MAAPSYFTWEGDAGNGIPPRRPSTEDLGGDELQDDPEFPPDPDIHPTAGGWNQKVDQIAGMARVTTAARIEVRFTAGVPAIYRIVGPRVLLVGDLVIYDDGVGVVRIKDTSGKLPVRGMAPGALTILDDTAGPGGVQWGKAYEVAANEIRIRLFEGTTPADLNFRVDWD